MSMSGNGVQQTGPRTEVLRRVLAQVHNEAVAADLLFLEDWQMGRCLDIASSLRASQIRRANPQLAAAIDDELHRR
jgi:hypothetical protein